MNTRKLMHIMLSTAALAVASSAHAGLLGGGVAGGAAGGLSGALSADHFGNHGALGGNGAFGGDGFATFDAPTPDAGAAARSARSTASGSAHHAERAVVNKADASAQSGAQATRSVEAAGAASGAAAAQRGTSAANGTTTPADTGHRPANASADASLDKSVGLSRDGAQASGDGAGSASFTRPSGRSTSVDGGGEASASAQR